MWKSAYVGVYQLLNYVAYLFTVCRFVKELQLVNNCFCIWCNRKVCCRTHKIIHLAPFPCHVVLGDVLPSSFHFNVITSTSRSLTRSVYFRFGNYNCACSTHACHISTSFIVLDFSVLIFAENCKSRHSSHYALFLQPAVSSSRLCPNIFITL